MKRIEEIIKNNRDNFDQQEPPEGHFGRFREKLSIDRQERDTWFERYAIAWRVAAAIVVFITVSILLYTGKLPGVKSLFTTRIASAELPKEFMEVMQYYNILTDNKVSQIDELAASPNEATRIKEKAMKELQVLDDARTELEDEYEQNPNSERILNALMLNQRKRAEILDRIINTLNQTN